LAQFVFFPQDFHSKHGKEKGTKRKTQRMSTGGKVPGYTARMEAQRKKSEQKLEKKRTAQMKGKPELPSGKSSQTKNARLKKRRSKGFSA
jgi:hypothetical protein